MNGGQWVLFERAAMVEAMNAAASGSVSPLAAFIGYTRPTIENDAGRWFFVAPLLDRLPAVEGELAPGLRLMPAGTSLEVLASSYEGHARLSPLADLHRYQVTAETVGADATAPLSAQIFDDLRCVDRSDRLPVTKRLETLRAFIRTSVPLAYTNARYLAGMGASMDAIEAFNLGIRGLLLRPELVAQELFLALCEEASRVESPEPVYEDDTKAKRPLGLRPRRSAGTKPGKYKGPAYEDLERVALKVAAGSKPHSFVAPGAFASSE